MTLISNNCADEELIDLVNTLALLLSQNGYYEEHSAELQSLLDSNFLIHFIERTEQKIEIIKLEHAGKKMKF